MARALAASEREKSKARAEASTPIRNAIIGKLNMIIGLVANMGAHLNATQWAAVLLASSGRAAVGRDHRYRACGSWNQQGLPPPPDLQVG